MEIRPAAGAPVRQRRYVRYVAAALITALAAWLVAALRDESVSSRRQAQWLS